MQDTILIRYGEIGLKGKNQAYFINTLISRIKQTLAPVGKIHCRKTHGRIFIEVQGGLEEAMSRLQKVFGIVSLSPVQKLPLDLALIKDAALEELRSARDNEGGSTFKVITRRANKAFPLTSPELNQLVGGYLLDNTIDLQVDLNNPDIKVNLEIREDAYIYSRVLPGPGGLPVGVSSRAVLLLSGGIDSPVAGWMAMKRGVNITPVYFHSYPFTGDRTKEKVIELCRILAGYGGKLNLHVVHFTEIQKALQQYCPEDFGTILMRRMMMRLAERIAQQVAALALITGESIGQVASQTVESLVTTNAVVNLPVFRPLIGLDKEEIIERAQVIGTYDTSILPYEDCCTLFVPKHPQTRPSLAEVEKAEETLALGELIQQALEQTEVITVAERL
jgi:thiamine biosynthesis protein ThiI